MSGTVDDLQIPTLQISGWKDTVLDISGTITGCLI